MNREEEGNRVRWQMSCITEPRHMMATVISSYVHLIKLEKCWNVKCSTAAANTYLKKRNIFLLKYLQHNIGNGSVYKDLFF